jgi:hypothetical protein
MSTTNGNVSANDEITGETNNMNTETHSPSSVASSTALTPVPPTPREINQGIPRDVNVHRFLPEYARADFIHDFTGENITTDSLNSIETLGNRTEFYNRILTLIQNGDTGRSSRDVVEAFETSFNHSIPPVLRDEPTVRRFDNERDLLTFGNVPYNFVETTGTSVFDITSNVPIEAHGISRTYTISRVVEKLKPTAKGAEGYREQLIDKYLKGEKATTGQYINIASCLHALTGGKTKFAIMYDAGTCALSDLNNKDLPHIQEVINAPIKDLPEKYSDVFDIYFINSSENLRDPAPKITSKTFTEPKHPKINLHFLNDYGHHGEYEMFNYYIPPPSTPPPITQTKNLYSQYTLRTVRGNDDIIHGTIDFRDGSQKQLSDLKQQSSIKNCVTNAITFYLTNSPPVSPYEKVWSSFFLKRSGDWCQALCLLDKTRKYSLGAPAVPSSSSASSSAVGEGGEITTLQYLEDKDDVEIMLMTHDRILLAYALSLGLNVCFTNNRASGHWMIYFKNEATETSKDDWEDRKKEANILRSQLENEQKRTNVLREWIETNIKEIEWNDMNDFIRLRQYAYTLANLVSNTEIQKLIVKLKELHESIGNSKDTVNIDNLRKLRQLLPIAQSTFNLSLKSTIETYPQKGKDEETIANFQDCLINNKQFKQTQTNKTTRKPYNLVADFNVMAERLINDLIISNSSFYFDVKIGNVIVDSFSSITRDLTRSQVNNVKSMCDIFIKAQGKRRPPPLPSTGGANREELEWFAQAMYYITQIAIDGRFSSKTEDDSGNIINGYNPFITHYDGWSYSFLTNDPYIVTKEHRRILVDAIRNITTPLYKEYLILRLFYLDVDIQRNLLIRLGYKEYLSLLNQINTEDTSNDTQSSPTIYKFYFDNIRKKLVEINDAINKFTGQSGEIFDNIDATIDNLYEKLNNYEYKYYNIGYELFEFEKEGLIEESIVLQFSEDGFTVLEGMSEVTFLIGSNIFLSEPAETVIDKTSAEPATEKLPEYISSFNDSQSSVSTLPITTPTRKSKRTLSEEDFGSETEDYRKPKTKRLSKEPTSSSSAVGQVLGFIEPKKFTFATGIPQSKGKKIVPKPRKDYEGDFELGGLRTKRRHTYRKKHVQTSSTRTRSNERLRKRTRARTTYRVRKHPGKSKTRRQRNNLDRV